MIFSSLTLLDVLVNTGECLVLYGFGVGFGGVESRDECIDIERPILCFLVVCSFLIFLGLLVFLVFLGLLVFFGFGGVFFFSDATEGGFAGSFSLPGVNWKRVHHVAG